MNKKLLSQQAHRLVVARTQHGGKVSDKKPIISIGSERDYKSCMVQFLAWRWHMELPVNGPYMQQEMLEYLEDQSEVLLQSTLDQHRQALQLVFTVQFTPVQSIRNSVLRGKDLTKSEIEKIITTQTDKMALSTLVCLDAGLRASELLTLQPIDIQTPSQGRSWRIDLFSAREKYSEFTVHGKGGLLRRVAIDNRLVDELNAYKNTASNPRTDRGIHRTSAFDLAGGQSFSQSFSKASEAAIGYSLGAHCLRHIWAKNRFFDLRNSGKSAKTAMHIVSQESGHFRPEITLTYLQH
jgi:integrase